MSDQADAQITTGGRVWALTWRLALPWIVCGGLLWALVGLTPDCLHVDGPLREPSPMLSAELTRDRFPTGHPAGLFLGWNDRGYLLRLYEVDQRSPEFAEVDARLDLLGVPLGIGWTRGKSGLGRWGAFSISVWWLLPFPLLWSGFNLWRWVRRAK